MAALNLMQSEPRNAIFFAKKHADAGDHIPELGPGDFKNNAQTPQEAINDIIDFYCGNPERIEVINQMYIAMKNLKA